MFKKFWVFLFIIQLLAPKANAWNGFGHMLVAYIAYKDLDPKITSELTNTLRNLPRYQLFRSKLKNPSSDENLNCFVLCATWPDAIRIIYGRPSPYDDTNGVYARQTQNWHFADYLYSRPGDTTYLNQTFSLAIPNSLSVIDQQLTLLNNPNTPLTDKAKAICWIEHLAGDLHQPLHNCSLIYSKQFKPPRGDYGGNEIRISSYPYNLHSYWDSVLGSATDIQSISKTGDLLIKLFPRNQVSGVTTLEPPTLWAQEANNLGKTVAYACLPPISNSLNQPITLNTDYKSTVLKTATSQIVLAGHRLATYIENNVK